MDCSVSTLFNNWIRPCGYRHLDQWIGQIVVEYAVGLTMLGGFSVGLGWIFIRGLSRFKIWITKEEVRIQRSLLGMRKETVMTTSNIARFQIAATDTVFDITLKTKDGKSIPAVKAHTTVELDTWKKALEEVALVIYQTG